LQTQGKVKYRSMSLAGEGVIAIWQDLVPEAKQEYREWHNRQHVPERLSIPGFRRARRFVAVRGSPEFYTLYEADTPETVRGKAYLDRLNAPTEWTRRIMPAFRNMARSVCRVAYSEGVGEGGFIVTCRFALPPAKESETILEIREQLLPPICDLPGVAGVHLCLADESASTIPTFEKTFRTATDLVSPCVLMIEGSSLCDVTAAMDRLESRLVLLLDGLHLDTAIYQLEHAHANIVFNGRATAPVEVHGTGGL
jgi:hypothetical protein